MSYAHADEEAVEPLVEALADIGLRVWFDATAVDDFASISRGVENGVRHAKALLAFYSSTYPSRRACQWELTAAFLAAQRLGDPRERVLVINPEQGVSHIEPVELRDARFRTAPTTDDERAELAVSVKRHVAALDGELRAVSTRLPPFYGLKPLASTRFVGRMPDFWRLHSALQLAAAPLVTGEHDPSVAAVVGMGGVGKTLMAEEYALRFAAAYPGGVFWLRAAGSDGPFDEVALEGERQRQLGRLARKLGLDPAADVERALGEEIDSRGPTLWIVDDLPEGLNATQIRRWLSPSPSAPTIVTTRSRRYGALARTVELDVFDQVDGYELLTRRRDLEPAEAEAGRALVEDLGRLPLAIDVAAGAIVASGQTLAAFRTSLGDPSRDELELAAELADVLPSGHQASVAATFLRSLALLSPPARDFVTLAAQFGPAPVRLDLLAASYRTLGLPATEADARAEGGAGEARELSLTAGDGDQLRPLHALIRRTVRRASSRERQETLRNAAAAALADVLVRVTDAQQVIDRGPEFVHARVLVTDLAAERAAVLERLLARDDVFAGRFDAAAALLEKAIADRSKTRGPDDIEIIRARKDLVGVLRDRGDYAAARDLAEIALADSRRTFGDRDFTTSSVLIELGLTLERLGEPERAKATLAEALAIRLETNGVADRETLRVKAALADVFRAQHDLESAVRLQEEICATAAENPDLAMVVLRATNALASLRHDQGDLAAARELFERVLVVRRERFGDDHPLTLATLNNLGQVKRSLGDQVGLRALNEEVLAATRRRVGPSHPNTLTAMTNLALALEDEGQLGRAIELHQEVLTARRARLGESHRATLVALQNVGSVLVKLGRADEARPLLEQAAEGLIVLVGPHHPDTLTTRLNLARALDQQDEQVAALAIAREVLVAHAGVDGDDHPRTVAALGSLARMLERAGEHAEAAALFARMHRAAGATLGPEHPLTKAASQGLERVAG